MKRVRTGAFLAAIIAVGCVAPPAFASQSDAGNNAVAQAAGAPDLGSPPSGEVPILYNDHHVYSKPDTLKQGRVLAALVKNGTLLIPLRSMFEQMGATVSYDASAKTATVSKAGAEVKVTVGKPEVSINGETRPLDVPPMIYKGTVLVPVRVISEGMGAYVQWVPQQKVVVVRYVPPTPPPTPAPPPPAPPATPAPTPTPAPPPVTSNSIWLAGDYLISPKIYNEFAPGNQANGSWTARGGVIFDVKGLPFMFEVDYKNWQYPHNCGVPAATATQTNAPQCFVTGIGSRFSTFVPAFTATNRDLDLRLGFRVFQPHVYVGIGYIWTSTNYGYPNMNAVGFGAEKLPDNNPKQPFQYYGSVYYYPNVKGTYTNSAINTGPTSYGIGYNLLKYQVGVGYMFFPDVWLDAGWAGENGANKNNAPISYSFNGPYVGLGFFFKF